MLNQEGGKLGLCDYRELRISAAYVPFPVGVLSRIGCWIVAGGFPVGCGSLERGM